MDIAETTTQVATIPQADLMSKGKSRRKLGIQKPLTQECKPSEGAGDSGSDKLSYSLSNIIDLKVLLSILFSVLVVVFHYLAWVKSHLLYSNLMQDKLSHCLSSRLLRRWCMFEWFYSAIDYPWFAKSEFVEYLNHVKLGHVPRLTRVEWGVIRRFAIFNYFVRFSCICPLSVMFLQFSWKAPSIVEAVFARREREACSVS